MTTGFLFFIKKIIRGMEEDFKIDYKSQGDQGINSTFFPRK